VNNDFIIVNISLISEIQILLQEMHFLNQINFNFTKTNI